MAKEQCTRSISQPVTRLVTKGKAGAADHTSLAWLDFHRGKNYDLSKVNFHYDKKINAEILEDVRKTSFKKGGTK